MAHANVLKELIWLTTFVSTNQPVLQAQFGRAPTVYQSLVLLEHTGMEQLA